VSPSLSIGVQIAIVFLLVALSAYAACAETALTSLSEGRLSHLRNANPRKRRAFSLLLSEPNAPITTLLVLNNVADVGASAVTTLLALHLLPSGAPDYVVGLVATGVGTLVLLVLGEIAPKNFAKHNAERVTLATIGQVYVLTRALWPVVYAFRAAAAGLLRLVGVNLREREPEKVSDEQIETLIDAGEESGLLDERDGEMMRRILDFDERTAEHVMVPRTDVSMIEVHTPLAQAREVVARDGHSRFPVYDRVPDNVVGMLYAKDLLAAPGDREASLRSFLRPVHYTPTSRPVNDLLRDFQRGRIHLAVVIDEFGGMAGIVALEDILEEIVGEIEDEFDRPVSMIERLSPDEAIVAGDTQVHQLNRLMDLDLPEDKAVTVGGLLLERLEAMPKAGNEVQIGPVLLAVEKASAKEVESVRVRVERPPAEEDGSGRVGAV